MFRWLPQIIFFVILRLIIRLWKSWNPRILIRINNVNLILLKQIFVYGYLILKLLSYCFNSLLYGLFSLFLNHRRVFRWSCNSRIIQLALIWFFSFFVDIRLKCTFLKLVIYFKFLIFFIFFCLLGKLVEYCVIIFIFNRFPSQSLGSFFNVFNGGR